jgi:hypothetical protein
MSILSFILFKHIEYFDILDMKHLILPRLLRVDAHRDFHFIGTDPMVVLSFSENSSINISWNKLIQSLDSSFYDPTLNKNTNY